MQAQGWGRKGMGVPPVWECSLAAATPVGWAPRRTWDASHTGRSRHSHTPRLPSLPFPSTCGCLPFCACQIRLRPPTAWATLPRPSRGRASRRQQPPASWPFPDLAHSRMAIAA
eukprot:353138-Chlamydomonas_euryale.AAC.10